MSMEDILKILVDSRRQTSSPQGAADPMTDLIGSLLSGTATAQGMRPQGGGSHAPIPPQGWMAPDGGSQTAGLGDLMGILETFMGTQGGQVGSRQGDPIMDLLQPFVNQLAKKMNLSPAVATIIVSFLVHKLLAHHPTSQRDSNTFDLDVLLGQMGSGHVDPGLLRSSGMVRELSRKTGLDEQTTEESLQLALGLVGRTVSGMAGKSSQPRVTTASPSKGKAVGKGFRSSGMKRGGK
jgi:hypothetical protein